jgi:hypothetical protein
MIKQWIFIEASIVRRIKVTSIVVVHSELDKTHSEYNRDEDQDDHEHERVTDGSQE